MQQYDFNSQLAWIVDHVADVAAALYGLLLTIDVTVLILLNVILFLLCRNDVLPKSRSAGWSKLLGGIAAFGFVVYCCLHDPYESLLIVAIRAILVVFICTAACLIACVAVELLWWLLVRMPIAKGRRFFRFLGGRIVDCWNATCWTWKWLKKRWRRFWAPKPKTREERLREAVIEVKEQYELRAKLIEEAELNQVEERAAEQSARQSLLRRLQELLR